MGTPGLGPPTRGQMLRRGLTGRCAVCGSSMLTRTWLQVRERCDTCDFPIERKEGHFIGAVGMNTIVTFGVVLIALVLTAMFGGRQPPMSLVFALVGVVIVIGVGFFPISKTLWSAVDLIMIPLEPGEADPRFDHTDYVDGS